MKQAVVALLVAILMAPLAQSAWIEDNKGDATGYILTAEADHGRDGAVDLYSIDIEETDLDVRFTVLHAPTEGPAETIADAVQYNLRFNHGTVAYRAIVYFSVPVATTAQYSGSLFEAESGYLRDFDVEGIEGGFAFTLDKSWIRNEHGLQPTLGSELSEVWMESRSQNEGTFCISECVALGAGSWDQAPDGDTRATYAFTTGLAQEGDLRLASASPVRWSNGAATVFVYDVKLTNVGEDDVTVTLSALDVPSSWRVAFNKSVSVMAQQTLSIPVAVQVPFSHEHGGDPKFLMEARALTGVGRVELGVHYPEVAQPTGHHPELYFHTRETGAFVPMATLFKALGGNIETEVFMNTVQDYDSDESIPVAGVKGMPLFGFSAIDNGSAPTVGYEYDWAIPLSPSLRVGLQPNATQIGAGAVDLKFDAPVGDVRVTGRVALLEGSYELIGTHVDKEQGTDFAVIPVTELTPISGTVNVPFQLDMIGAKVPFQEEQQLVLFLTAEVMRPDAPLTPNTGVYLTEGRLQLPLDEFHDVIPASIDFSPAEQAAVIDTLASPDEATETKGASAPGAMLALAAVSVAAAVMRKRP